MNPKPFINKPKAESVIAMQSETGICSLFDEVPITDISVIILVGKEGLHIQRCLEKLNPLHPREVFIIESQHGDNTHSLAISTAHSLSWSVKDTVLD